MPQNVISYQNTVILEQNSRDKFICLQTEPCTWAPGGCLCLGLFLGRMISCSALTAGLCNTYTPVFWSLKSVVLTCQAIVNNFMDDPEHTPARNSSGHSFGTDLDSCNIKLKLFWKYIGSEVPVFCLRLVLLRIGLQVTPSAGISAWGISRLT